MGNPAKKSRLEPTVERVPVDFAFELPLPHVCCGLSLMYLYRKVKRWDMLKNMFISLSLFFFVKRPLHEFYFFGTGSRLDTRYGQSNLYALPAGKWATTWANREGCWKYIQQKGFRERFCFENLVLVRFLHIWFFPFCHCTTVKKSKTILFGSWHHIFIYI